MPERVELVHVEMRSLIFKVNVLMKPELMGRTHRPAVIDLKNLQQRTVKNDVVFLVRHALWSITELISELPQTEILGIDVPTDQNISGNKVVMECLDSAGDIDLSSRGAIRPSAAIWLISSSTARTFIPHLP